MRAVWSFWSLPYFAGCGRWYTDCHHWLGWGLSLHTASRFYPDTHLITDDHGARILVDQLHLPFTSVSTALNKLSRVDADWWSLGKLEAYRLQRDPFVHLDADVFLWKRLAPHLEDADVLVQSPEPIVPGEELYKPEELENVIQDGGLPEEWRWYRRHAPTQEGQCCGVFGGNRVDFIEYYAEAAMRLVCEPRNRAALKTLPDRRRHMPLVEQFLLTACVEYHRAQKESPYHGIELRHIFPTINDAYNRQKATDAGFTHLAGGVKQHARVARDLEARMQLELPEYYERCTGLFLAQAERNWAGVSV